MGKEIFDTVELGGLTLKNRLIRSATWEGIAAPDGDFSQAERITHRGMLLVGTYDNFTKGDPAAFRQLDEEVFNAHFERESSCDALADDLRFKESLGIWQLPAFLAQCGEATVLLKGVPSLGHLTTAIARVTQEASA